MIGATSRDTAARLVCCKVMMRAAVIGAGMAGWTAAALLANRGFEVTILEAHVEGGVGNIAETLQAQAVKAQGAGAVSA